jgi:Photosynthetic reaction centre cytochrome C subunit
MSRLGAGSENGRRRRLKPTLQAEARATTLCAMVLFAAGCARAQATMLEINRALGVECSHCHTVDDWKKGDKPEFAFAGRMMKMVEGLNAGTLRGVGSVSCWTCHRGNVKPARMPRASWQERLDKWPEALKLSAEDAKKPAREVYQNVPLMGNSAAGGLAMTMSVFAGALGVSCDYCHVPGRWDSDEKAAKKTARVMLGLFTEVPTYFEKSRQPGMQCFTCHQGSDRIPLPVVAAR